MENNHHIQTSLKWLEGFLKGDIGTICLDGIQIEEVRVGFLRCYFVVPPRLADKYGNWEVGAIATLIDSMGAIVINSFNGTFNVTAQLNISFLSTAKIQEEVEIEAKVIGKREKLASVAVDARRKNNGELIASGKQWLASTSIDTTQLISKI